MESYLKNVSLDKKDELSINFMDLQQNESFSDNVSRVSDNAILNIFINDDCVKKIELHQISDKKYMIKNQKDYKTQLDGLTNVVNIISKMSNEEYKYWVDKLRFEDLSKFDDSFPSELKLHGDNRRSFEDSKLSNQPGCSLSLFEITEGKLEQISADFEGDRYDVDEHSRIEISVSGFKKKSENKILLQENSFDLKKESQQKQKDIIGYTKNILTKTNISSPSNKPEVSNIEKNSLNENNNQNQEKEADGNNF